MIILDNFFKIILDKIVGGDIYLRIAVPTTVGCGHHFCFAVLLFTPCCCSVDPASVRKCSSRNLNNVQPLIHNQRLINYDFLNFLTKKKRKKKEEENMTWNWDLGLRGPNWVVAIVICY